MGPLVITTFWLKEWNKVKKWENYMIFCWEITENGIYIRSPVIHNQTSYGCYKFFVR